MSFLRAEQLKPLALPLAAAAVLGLVQTYFAVVCWSAIGLYTPVPAWFIEQGLRGGAFRAAMVAVDFVTNVVLSVPAAFLLLQLRPARLRLYLAAAVLPSFAWLNQNLLDTPSLGFLAVSWPLLLLPLPLAAWLLRRWMPQAPRSSGGVPPLPAST